MGCRKKPAPEPASTCPKAPSSLESASGILLVRRSSLALVGGNLAVLRNQLSLQTITSRSSPLVLVHKGSALPWLVGDRATLHPRRIQCLLAQQYTRSDVLARTATPFQIFRDSVTCLSRAPRSRRTPYWRSGEAHLTKPSRHNQAATGCQPTGWARWTASWCYLSRVNPSLHAPESLLQHTHILYTSYTPYYNPSRSRLLSVWSKEVW